MSGANRCRCNNSTVTDVQSVIFTSQRINVYSHVTGLIRVPHVVVAETSLTVIINLAIAEAYPAKRTMQSRRTRNRKRPTNERPNTGLAGRYSEL